MQEAPAARRLGHFLLCVKIGPLVMEIPAMSAEAPLELVTVMDVRGLSPTT